MTYALTTGAQHLEQLMHEGLAFRQKLLSSPAPHAPAHEDMQDRGSPLGQFSFHIGSTATLVIMNAEEHLASIGHVLPAKQGLVRPLYTLVRSALEASARAWWQLQPGLDQRQRVHRRLVDRFYSLWEERQIDRDLAPQVDDGINDLTRRASLAGFEVKRTSKGFTVDGVRRQGHMAVVSELLSDVGEHFDAGRTAYRVASGVAHSTDFAIRHHMRPSPGSVSSVPGFAMGATGTTAEEEASTVLGALIGYMRATDSFLNYYGYEGGRWMQHLVWTASEFRRHVTVDGTGI